jgi:hypothetical protein
MMSWFRARVSFIATFALVAMAVVGGSAVVPHEDDCHDVACQSIAVIHDASAHRVGVASFPEEDHALHCVLCHWARTFRPRPEARVVSSSSAAAPLALTLQLFVTAAGAPVSQPPLRSPPAFPSVA